jgi:hypothetical protein
VPGDAEGLQDVACVGAEMNHVAVGHGRAAFKADAELVAHDARAAVAAGEEVAAHLFGDAGLDGAQRRRHPIGVLLEVFESHAPACIDQRTVQDGGLQHRLDHDLTDPHRRLARLGAVVPG